MMNNNYSNERKLIGNETGMEIQLFSVHSFNECNEIQSIPKICSDTFSIGGNNFQDQIHNRISIKVYVESSEKPMLYYFFFIFCMNWASTYSEGYWKQKSFDVKRKNQILWDSSKKSTKFSKEISIHPKYNAFHPSFFKNCIKKTTLHLKCIFADIKQQKQ